MKISVTKSKDGSRSAPWMVRYYTDRRAVRRFFETKEEAELRAKEIRESLRLGANPTELSEACRLLAGTGHKLPKIVQMGLQFLRESEATRVSPTATFADGVAKLLAEATNCRRKTLASYRQTFGRLNETFGARVATSITSREVQSYLDLLSDRQGTVGKASPYTKQTVLVHIRMILRGLGINNPLPKLDVRIPPAREIEFFTNEQIRTILAAADPTEKGMVALATFAAIRPETLERLPPECVNVADKIIRIPAELSKDHRPHFLETIPIGTDREVRPGPPAVLWDWLSKYPFKPRKWNSVQRRLRRALKGVWIQDGLRHSGATYYRAKYGDAATAELLTHASIKMVNEHYAGIATRAQAEEFLSMGVNQVAGPTLSPFRPTQKIPWPSDTELEQMLMQKPAVLVAKDLGCSDSMISKRCKLRGIRKRPRGAWTAAQA